MLIIFLDPYDLDKFLVVTARCKLNRINANCTFLSELSRNYFCSSLFNSINPRGLSKFTFPHWLLAFDVYAFSRIEKRLTLDNSDDC